MSCAKQPPGGIQHGATGERSQRAKINKKKKKLEEACAAADAVETQLGRPKFRSVFVLR